MSATQDEIFRRFMQDPRDACDEYATNQALRDLERGRSALLEKKLAEAEQKLTAQSKAIDELCLALTNAEREAGEVERGRMKDAQFVCPHCGEELKSRWIPVSERLPEFRMQVLAYERGRKYPRIMAREKSSSDLWSWANRTLGGFVGYVDDVSNITHWMPLPEPPAEE